MSNREVMQQALEALDSNNPDIQLRAAITLRTALEQPEQGPVRMPCVGKDPRCPCQDGDACHYKDCGNTKAWPVPQAEPTPWRDMVVVSLVREGIDKHRARELADHFAPQQQAEPVAYFDFQELKFSWAKHMKISPVPVSVKVEPMKLYSEAAQRQWVGLTDEDWAKVADMPDSFDQGVAWAQARLKERNT